MVSNFKLKPWRSEKYRRFVASLPCAICQGVDVQSHHEQPKGHGTMGGKASDEYCIPLCVLHHRMRHLGFGFLRKTYKTPAHIVASTQAEWLARGNKPLWLPNEFAK